MEVNQDGKKTKFDLGLTISKYILFLLNGVFVISSVLTMSSGVSTIVAFTSYYNLMEGGFQVLSIFWIVVGFIFMIVALFGMFVAFKESTALANLYGIAMMVVFVLQVSAAIVAFTLISKSRYMVSDQLDTMMRDYNYRYQLEVDWIQSKFECCGVNGPSDWQNFARFSTPYYYETTESYYYRTSDYYYRTDDYYRTTDPTTTTSTEPPRTDLMPQSCCVRNSNYVNLTCEKYHTSGCFVPIHQIVSESIMMIGSSTLVVSVLQILGVILGFMYARIVRRKKTQRDVQIWNSGQEYSTTPGFVRQPTHGDYSQM